jgi:hypothetical protein
MRLQCARSRHVASRAGLIREPLRQGGDAEKSKWSGIAEPAARYADLET